MKMDLFGINFVRLQDREKKFLSVHFYRVLTWVLWWWSQLGTFQLTLTSMCCHESRAASRMNREKANIIQSPTRSRSRTDDKQTSVGVTVGRSTTCNFWCPLQANAELTGKFQKWNFHRTAEMKLHIATHRYFSLLGFSFLYIPVSFHSRCRHVVRPHPNRSYSFSQWPFLVPFFLFDHTYIVRFHYPRVEFNLRRT